MIKSILNSKNTKEADVVLIGAGYEKTASSHKGTAKGPKAVARCLDGLLEFFNPKYKKEVNDFVKIFYQDLGSIGNLSPEKVFSKIKSASEKLISEGKFVFILGGEHSVPVGLLHALAKKYNPKDVTILQIDAHCDLRDDDSDYSTKPSKLAHSTVLRRASDLGYKIVQVGIRTYSKEEYEYFKNPKNNVTVFEWGLKKPKVEEIIKAIKTKYLYITIDADGFDAAHMPGTGTPVPGGVEWWYGIDLLERAIKKSELIGADIVEVSPVPDSVLTEYSAAELCYRIISDKFAKRLK
ncbi:MAG TPA: agmatinase [Candidatus Paceibacterota bacterium]|nr:agmatinase [Candidatus Paceibacterota bacterium]